MKTEQRKTDWRGATCGRALPRRLLLAPLLLATACTTQTSVLAHYPAPPAVKPTPIPVAPVAMPDEVAPLLTYHQSLRRMTQGELLKELSGLLQQQRTPKVALQMGMTLTLVRGGGDLARAQTLFDGVANANDPQVQGLRAFAQLLSSHCAEARRLTDTADRLAMQVKDGQRRTEQLTDTVEALKAIERGLPVRPASAPAASSGAASAPAGSTTATGAR
ncbi:hypothetical protein IP91_02133 [Pseudoduganella lurida]|uniref:Permease n=1 Tax=Pseudoduganella lurida TaxID=1036180 RepID=A0A562RB74_9BURK|nr:hypothetical protein [Pseudoduganella lurida]TWI66321.1 hypothetical protein IP91_02133 [Pseudoduganella lurida]